MLGLMISFSKIDGVECTTSYVLMTEILKNERGFKGYAVTDIYDDTNLYIAALASGTTCFDTLGVAGFYGSTTLANCWLFPNQTDGSIVSSEILLGDANLQNAVKESVHNVLFAISQSNLVNRYNSTTRIENQMTWWRALYLGLIILFAILTVVCSVLYVLASKKADAMAEF